MIDKIDAFCNRRERERATEPTTLFRSIVLCTCFLLLLLFCATWSIERAK